MPVAYKKNPIVEATISFRVTLSSGMESGLQELKTALLDSYPLQDTYFEETAEVTFNPDGSTANIERSDSGFRLTSNDKQRVLIVSEQIFSFTNLRPYNTWETLRDDAMKHWNEYKAACYPEHLKRVGLRYINRVDFPASEALSDYVALYPELPADMPQRQVSGSFMQLQMPQNDISSTLIINQARVEAHSPENVSIILDFDLFREMEWEINRDNEAWDLLETFRVRKNAAFESCITQKMRDLIQ